MNQSDPEASIRAAYIDAKARGLPDCWRCSIDKRNRRKWTAPTGRSCDSIPKALAISVELGLLPPDFPIQSGPNKRKRSDISSSSQQHSSSLMPKAKRPNVGRPSHNNAAQNSNNNDSNNPQQSDDDDDDVSGAGDDDDEEEKEPSSQTPPPAPAAAAPTSSLTSATTMTSKRRGPGSLAAAAAAIQEKRTSKPPAEDSENDAVEEQQQARKPRHRDEPRQKQQQQQPQEKTDTSSEEEEEEDEDVNDATPPEPMNPELSLDGLRRSAAPTTVHWDPYGANGKLIGMSVRVATPPGSSFGEWLDGRVILYDPYTHKHKIQWTLPSDANNSDNDSSPGDSPIPGKSSAAVSTSNTKKAKTAAAAAAAAAATPQTSWIWLRNEEHNIHIATRLVWAHVKGYAWWPALVREANTEENVAATVVNKSVKVDFFGTGEVATLRDSPDSLRPFHPLNSLDAVVAKHKKKRNAKATALATAEWYTMRHTRNQAAIWYARKAWNMANIVSGQVPYVGKQVQVFRDDVNYPYGDTLTGKVHAYSHYQKKWLVSYEMSAKNAKYEASWLNLQNKQVSCRILCQTRKAAKQPTLKLEDLTGEDLLPYLYGFDLITVPDTFDPTACEDLEEDEVQFQMQLSRMWQERCHACLEHKKSEQTFFNCSVCSASYHLGCCDPPMTVESYIRMVKDGKPLICSRCVTCRGCYQRDVTFGSHTHSPLPVSLTFPAGESLELCSMCKDAYERKQFCPNCAHTWDDVKFHKIRRQIEHLGRGSNQTGPGRKRKLSTDTIAIEDSSSATLTGQFSVDLIKPAGAKIDPSWYHPETVEWGFTEIEMLVCDSCKVWVHAGCAGISEDEYNETSEGDHEIFSKEFLCRHCCKQRCIELVLNLQQEDRMGLFASAVTEDAAPNYRDVIKEPMDLQTMLEKAEKEDHQHYAWVRETFELIVLNALTFNNFGTKVWNEAKRFYHNCLENVFSENGKAAPPGKHDKMIQKNFDRAEEARKKEEDRVQVDESVEKKDLVAGSLETISLPNLREAPPDQPSCVPHTEVQLASVDAFYCAWLDCCFTCGSSGAADTMLFCVDCGEAYHSFCVNAPVHSMAQWAANCWRCPNCKVCEISGDVPRDETSLIYCEMCDRAFSLHLLDPPLEKAPPGLWICGQCVDCKVCKNTADPRGASLKHWSRDPEKCFSCGGCEGLLHPDCVPSCNVCHKLLRGDEPDLANCVGCGSQVHCRCDPRAERHARSIDNMPRALKVLEMKPPQTYMCPTCYEPASENIPRTTMVDRKDVYRLAWSAIDCNDIPPGEDESPVDMYRMLTDRIEWEIRARWRSEYIGIIEDGMKFYAKARNEDGDPSSVVQLVFNRLVNMPLWKAQRALRFVNMARREQWEVKIELNSIQKVVMCAKLAAAYIDVACNVMRYDFEAHVRFAKRVVDLLQPPDEAGLFTLMGDVFEQTVSTDDLNLCDVDASGNFSEGDNDVSSDKGEKEGVICVNRYPEPLAGWDNRIDIGQPGEWKDPRECCLCHLCGDDDAGLHGSSDTIQEQSRWGLPIRLGRLLPMNDGCWVHTSCVLWTSEVYEEASDGMIHAAERARIRGAQLKCFGCGQYGATVGCNKSNCSFNFHFPCAKVCGAVFTSDKHVYCAAHKPPNSDLLGKESFEIMKALMVAPDKKSAGSEKESQDSDNEDLCNRVGGLVVHSLGKIEQKSDGFHSESYITPPGYFATRIFWSSVEPRKRTVYILQVGEGEEGHAEYSITPGDNPAEKIRGASITTVYATLVERVRKVNAKYFSHGDLFNTLPMARRSRKKTFGLNGPQFFGFGLNFVRKRLERLPGVEAVVSRLSQNSASYRFCFIQPDLDSIRDLQRRRAAVKAELELENTSGCARTEGIKAVAQSGGSGRITRALVRSCEQDIVAETATESAVTKVMDKGLNQVKYRKMKSVPMEQRLVARRSHIHGWGLFTKIDVPKNDPIVEYMGEVVRKPIADIRERQYEISGEGSCYMFRLDLNRILDATSVGCMARFMNHACNANAYAKVISIDTEYGQEKKIVVFANRDITAGEEITYDYKFPVEDGSLKCMCGAPNCIGRLN